MFYLVVLYATLFVSCCSLAAANTTSTATDSPIKQTSYIGSDNSSHGLTSRQSSQVESPIVLVNYQPRCFLDMSPDLPFCEVDGCSEDKTKPGCQTCKPPNVSLEPYLDICPPGCFDRVLEPCPKACLIFTKFCLIECGSPNKCSPTSTCFPGGCPPCDDVRNPRCKSFLIRERMEQQNSYLWIYVLIGASIIVLVIIVIITFVCKLSKDTPVILYSRSDTTSKTLKMNSATRRGAVAPSYAF